MCEVLDLLRSVISGAAVTNFEVNTTVAAVCVCVCVLRVWGGRSGGVPGFAGGAGTECV
jgi:hypothetical protein